MISIQNYLVIPTDAAPYTVNCTPDASSETLRDASSKTISKAVGGQVRTVELINMDGPNMYVKEAGGFRNLELNVPADRIARLFDGVIPSEVIADTAIITGEVIAGTAVITGGFDEDGNTIGLTDEQVVYYTAIAEGETLISNQTYLVIPASESANPYLVNCTPMDSSETIREAVDGWVESVDLFDSDAPDMYVNDEGKIRNLELNIPATSLADGDVIVGNVIITGGVDEEGDTIGMTDEQIVRYGLMAVANKYSNKTNK